MKIALMALLVVHGLIHAMGFAGAWGLAHFEGASPSPTNFPDIQPGTVANRALGLVWLAALILLVGAAVMVGMDNAGWRLMAGAGVAASLVVVALWWADAPMGAVANALVLAAVVFAPRLHGVAA